MPRVGVGGVGARGPTRRVESCHGNALAHHGPDGTLIAEAPSIQGDVPPGTDAIPTEASILAPAGSHVLPAAVHAHPHVSRAVVLEFITAAAHHKGPAPTGVDQLHLAGLPSPLRHAAFQADG